MSKIYAQSAVQCTAPCGKVGTFLRDDAKQPLSPIFDGLYALYPWMKANGWAMDEHDRDGFHPWRVSKPTTQPQPPSEAQ